MIYITTTQAILLYLKSIHCIDAHCQTFEKYFRLLLDGKNSQLLDCFFSDFLSSSLSKRFAIYDPMYYELSGERVRLYESEKPLKYNTVLEMIERDYSRRVFETVLAKESIVSDPGSAVRYTQILSHWNIATRHHFVENIIKTKCFLKTDPQLQIVHDDVAYATYVYDIFYQYNVDDSANKLIKPENSRLNYHCPLFPELFNALQTLCSKEASQQDARLTTDLKNYIKELLLTWLLIRTMVSVYNHTLVLSDDYRKEFENNPAVRGRVRRSFDQSCAMQNEHNGSGKPASIHQDKMGIIHENTPIPFFDESPLTAPVPIQYQKPLISSILDKQENPIGWGEHLYEQKVQTFVNSFSGTIFYILRGMLSTSEPDESLKQGYFDDSRYNIGEPKIDRNFPPFPQIFFSSRESLLDFLRSFANIFVYATGGHTYYEVVHALKFSGITRELQRRFNFDFATLSVHEFLISRKIPSPRILNGFLTATQKAADYNAVIVNRTAVLEDIQKRTKIL